MCVSHGARTAHTAGIGHHTQGHSGSHAKERTFRGSGSKSITNPYAVRPDCAQPALHLTPPLTVQNTINARGTWLVSRTALPHLRASGQEQRNPHILTLSPPLDQGMFSRDPTVGAFPDQFAYTRALYAMSKFAMSVASFSLAAENMRYGIASNTLWPYTMIGTSAMRIVNPEAGAERTWRSPEILADAAVRIMGEDAKQFTYVPPAMTLGKLTEQWTLCDRRAVPAPGPRLYARADRRLLAGRPRDATR